MKIYYLHQWLYVVLRVATETVFDEKDDSTIDVVTKALTITGFNLHDWRIEVIGAIMYHGFDMDPYWSGL